MVQEPDPSDDQREAVAGPSPPSRRARREPTEPAEATELAEATEATELAEATAHTEPFDRCHNPTLIAPAWECTPLVSSSRRCFLSWLLAALFAPLLTAHAPHDDLNSVAVSPDYPTDGLVLIYASLLDHRIVGRSTDRGASWDQLGGPLAMAGVKRFVFSPDAANDGTVFAASESDGVWRSTDRGQSWVDLGGPLDQQQVTDVAVSPDFASDGVVLATSHVGLFRSDDGGDTWALVTTGLTEVDLRAVAFGKGTPAPVAYCGGLVMHRSDDLGLTWTSQVAFPSFLRAISTSPHHDTDQTAAACLLLHGVRTTNNGGALWRQANTGLTDLLTMDIELTDALTMLVATRNEGVFQSPDLDGPWTLDTSDFEELDPAGSSHYRSVMASPDWSNDGTAFVAAFEGLYRTEDHGANWTQLDVFHQLVDIRLAPSPRFVEDGLLYVGNYGGGVKLWHEPRLATTGVGAGRGGQMASGGELLGGAGQGPEAGPGSGGGAPKGGPVTGYWEARADGLGSKWCDSLDVSPDLEHDGTLFYGYWGCFRSLDGGRNWSKLAVPSGVQAVRDLAFSPDYANDRTVIFGTNATGVFRTSDGGDTWDDIATTLPADVRTRRVRFSPDFANDRTVYLATWAHKVLRSVDGGSTWAPSDAGITTLNMRGFALSPDFANDDTLLLGTNGDGVFLSTDRGDNWTPVNTGLVGSGPWSVEAVAFSPDFAVDRTAFCATMSGGVYKSTDGGLTWTLGVDGLPLTAMRDVLPSPGFAADRTVFLTSHEGVWVSRNAGETWSSLPAYVRVDDDHPVVEQAGTWIVMAAPGAYGTGVTGSNQPGDSASLSFQATSIRWYAQAGPDAGLAEVWIDGQLEALVDLYAPGVQPQVEFFAREFETLDWHQIAIVSVGSGNPESSGAWVRSDGWEWQR